MAFVSLWYFILVSWLRRVELFSPLYIQIQVLQVPLLTAVKKVKSLPTGPFFVPDIEFAVG